MIPKRRPVRAGDPTERTLINLELLGLKNSSKEPYFDQKAMIRGAFSHKKELNIQIFPHSNSHIIWGKKFRLGATQQTLLSVFSKNIQVLVHEFKRILIQLYSNQEDMETISRNWNVKTTLKFTRELRRVCMERQFVRGNGWDVFALPQTPVEVAKDHRKGVLGSLQRKLEDAKDCHEM